ncbi:MAG: enoyl-CoA hydratase-related protein [Chitinophagaceae bacterium]
MTGLAKAKVVKTAKYKQYKYIKVDPTYEDGIALVTLNRPEVLNALSLTLMEELGDALTSLDKDNSVKSVILTGSDRAFSVGADLKEVASSKTIDLLIIDQFSIWDEMGRFKKPLIAAVSGWVVGGGCELAMLCDMVVASETAKFGQPEIRRGIGSGAGGTQRMPRAVGKAKAMEIILTGDYVDAEEALRINLINHVYPVDQYLEGALKIARKIAELPPLAVRLAKESVNKAFNSTLSDGLTFERKNYYLTFSTEDQKEGIRAFLEKRKPNYKGN